MCGIFQHSFVLSIPATSYKQIFKVTVNSNMDIKYSDENVNIIEGGKVEMNVNTKGLPNARTTCTQTPLSGNATTCNNCAEDSACHYNVTEARPADKITVSTEVIGLQCSFLELDIIVTSMLNNDYMFLFLLGRSLVSSRRSDISYY